jgi:hypothetical protein
MSNANNVVLVAHTTDKSFVFPGIDADTEWNREWARKKIDGKDQPFKRRRGDALLLAHDMQNRLNTEYGVRELFLEERSRKRKTPPGASSRRRVEEGDDEGSLSEG